jgi:phenylalanyl-tRNA synthetase beta chain
LSELIDLEGLSPQEIGHQLTMKTALIEGVEEIGAGLDEVVIGRVVECRRHPDSEHLSVCQVTIAGPETLEIVCGAPNVARGQHVAVAPIGATIPGKDGRGLTMEARKIRGVRSQGMICSEKELGLGDDSDGILVLEGCAPVGARLVEHLALRDHVYEIDNKSITHRPDLWGHLGFARELAAIFARRMLPLELDTKLVAGAGPVPVTIEEPSLCGRYIALCVDDVSVAPSSHRIAQRLRACGMRPVNAIVDLSNYVMLEIGQPTHPFDRKCLAGDRIVVRRARAGETLETLDHLKRELGPDMLVIADAERATAIAGIMGGLTSEIGAATRNVLLESASFDAINVRKTATTLGLRTDAVARFEKFLDPNLAEMAVARLAFLLGRELAAAKIQRVYSESRTWVEGRRVLALRPERARKKLGLELTSEQIERSLTSIGFGVSVKADQAALSVTVPSFRGERDITGEDDLIEEVGRLTGYEKIPAVLPRVSCQPPQRDPLHVLEDDVTSALVTRCGFTEVLGYSMVDDQALAWAGVGEREPYLRLKNPITADAARLRRSLVPGMLRFLELNARFYDRFKLCEVGRGYLPEASTEPPLPHETRSLGASLFQRQGKDSSVDATLLELKGSIDELFHVLGRPCEFSAFTNVPAWAHPVRGADVMAGEERVGYVAELHPAVLDRLQLRAHVAVTELDLRALVRAPQTAVRFTPVPRFPPVKIDLAVVGGYEMTIREIVALMRSVEPSLLREVELFDVFTGTGVPEGKRSLAFRLSFRSDERTLTDEEVMKARDRVIEKLGAHGFAVRA